MKIRQYACFFQGAFDGNAPGRRNISQKLKSKEKIDFLTPNFRKFYFSSGSMPRYIFWGQQPPEHPENIPKKQILKDLL